MFLKVKALTNYFSFPILEGAKLKLFNLWSHFCIRLMPICITFS